MISKDFRTLAWNALRGKWMIAVLAGLIALVLGGSVINTSVGGIRFNINADTFQTFRYSFDLRGHDIAGIVSAAFPMLLGFFTAGSIGLLISLIVGGTVALGYAQFNLDAVDGRELRIETLFSRFSKYLASGVAMRLLVGLFTFLWSLLFVIPGIIASYRYSMTPYILAEHPEMGVMDAITASKELMAGNKFRLFCLHISFIGWDLLTLLTFGILSLWVHPYKEAANAAFYREVSSASASSQKEEYTTDGWSYGSSWEA